MRGLWIALRTRARLFWRRAQAERGRGTFRFIGILTVGLCILAIVFGCSFGGSAFLRMRGTLELVRPMLGSVLLGVMLGLLLSCLGHTANSFFTSHDLWFWNSTPVPPLTRFLDRLVGAAAASVPATLGIGGVAVMGLLMGAGHGLAPILRGVVVLILLPLLPLCCGVIFAHVGGVLLPAGRIRRISLFLVGLATCFFLVWLRSSRLEQFVTEEGAARFLASVKGIEDVGPSWLPTNLGAAFITDGHWFSFALFLTQVGGVFVIAYVMHRLCFQRARDLAEDESPTGLKPGSWQGSIIANYARLASGDTRYLVRKDLLAFIRDPSQWSQLMLLVGIAIIYLINCQALLIGFEQFTGIREVVLPAVHVGIVCFISAGLAARFAFVQVSLEGPAVWVLESAPVSPREILWGKFLVAYPLVGFFPLVTGLLGNLVLEFSGWVMIGSLVTIAIFGFAFTMIGIGRGAVSPLFDAVSVSEMAMAPGALSTMVVGIALCGAGAFATLLGAAFLYYKHLWPGGFLAVMTAAPVMTALLFLSWRAFEQGEAAFLDRRENGYSLRVASLKEEPFQG